MESRASTAGESHTECNIQQLRGLAQQVNEDAFLPLRPEELGPEFPRRLKSLYRLVNDVIECLKGRSLLAGKISISKVVERIKEIERLINPAD